MVQAVTEVHNHLPEYQGTDHADGWGGGGVLQVHAKGEAGGDTFRVH